MAKIDIRSFDGDIEIDEIQFGDDEYLKVGDDEFSEIFYIHSDGKFVPIYTDSISDLINALKQAKELWNE